LGVRSLLFLILVLSRRKVQERDESSLFVVSNPPFVQADQKQARVQKIAKGESLMINVGSTSTGGRVLAIKARLFLFFVLF
jgi:hypothetical protein